VIAKRSTNRLITIVMILMGPTVLIA